MHIELGAKGCGLNRNSMVLLERIRTIDKKRLKERLGKLDDKLMNRIENAIAMNFGLNELT